jgi:hypothetical protein
VTRMPFGKHRGQPLDEVPLRYLRWLIEDGVIENEERVTRDTDEPEDADELPPWDDPWQDFGGEAGSA